MASAGERRLHVRMPAGRADHVARHEQSRTGQQARVDGVAQIQPGPLRVERAHVAEGGEAEAHVLTRQVEA